MGIEWSSRYAVGIEAIDREHQELFRQVARLIEALHQAQGKDEVTRTLSFLGLYADSHFAMEERLMALHQFRGAADHAKEHTFFRATFAALTAQLQAQGPSPALAMEVNNKVCQWLVRHVLGSDPALAAHLKSRGVK